MKGNLARLVLAILIAIAVFVVLRSRELATPAKPKEDSAKTGSPEATPAPSPTARPSASAKPAGTATEREPASYRSPTELFTELFRRGEWSVSRGHDGRATGLQGLPIAGATVDSKSALAFARALARQLGVNPDQLSDAHSKADTETGLQTMYKYEQWVGGHPVFGGSLSVFSRRADSAAYLVNSSLKPVDQAPPAGIARSQAEALVLSLYKDRGGKIAAPVFASAYVYADQAPVELAWYFMVSVKSPTPMKLKVLLGATTQRVLYEGPALLN